MPAGVKRRALTALPLLLAAACAPRLDAPGKPVSMRPLAPVGALADRSFQQVLTMRFDAAKRKLIAAGEIRDGDLVLSLLTPEGLEVLRLRHGAGGLAILHRRDLPRGLTPQGILADFQLVHWPAAALRAAWNDAWTLEEGPRSRTASYRGRPRVRVVYDGERWRAPVTLEHETYGYRLHVKTLEHCLRVAAGGGGAACGEGGSASP